MLVGRFIGGLLTLAQRGGRPGVGSRLGLVILCLASGTAIAQSSSPETTGTSPFPDSTFVAAWSAPEPWRTDRFCLETSVYTRHFNTDSYHDDHQNLIALEWNVTERWLVGAAAFDNSFGQPSQFVYGGLRLRPFESFQQLYFKVAAGLVHGYKGAYQHKIPFNGSGIAPVITASMGYCLNRFCSELALFGTAAVVVTVGMTISLVCLPDEKRYGQNRYRVLMNVDLWLHRDRIQQTLTGLRLLGGHPSRFRRTCAAPTDPSA